jgi:hypothetical protein
MNDEIYANYTRIFTVWTSLLLFILAYTLPSPVRYKLAIASSVTSLGLPTVLAPWIGNDEVYIMFYYVMFWGTWPAHDIFWGKSY